MEYKEFKQRMLQVKKIAGWLDGIRVGDKVLFKKGTFPDRVLTVTNVTETQFHCDHFRFWKRTGELTGNTRRTKTMAHFENGCARPCTADDYQRVDNASRRLRNEQLLLTSSAMVINSVTANKLTDDEMEDLAQIYTRIQNRLDKGERQ